MEHSSKDSQELIDQVKKLTEEMGGEFNLFSCYDIPSQWRKIEIIFDKKTRDKKSTEN
jgi:hypothetical protein